MKRIGKHFLMTVFLLCAFCTITGCGKGKGDTIRIGVRSDIINFGYLNENTEKYYGLEIDIANEMTDRLGYSEVEFVTVLPENRKKMLLDGEVDALIAIYSISDTRKENFSFSEAYYTDKARIMVEKSTLFDELSDLKDAKVGIMNGSNTGPEFAIKMHELGIISEKVIENTDEYTKYEGMTVLKYDSYDALSEALEKGKIDAACLDGSIAQTYMNEDRKFMDVSLMEQNYGVATQKNSKLSKEVNRVIKEMLKDGTIASLIEKWN